MLLSNIVDFVLSERYRRKTAILFLFVVGSWLIVTVSLTYIIPYFSTKYFIGNYKNNWIAMDDRSQAIQVFDNNSKYLGIIPDNFETDFLTLQKPINVLGNNFYTDHKSILLNKHPEYFWQCIKFLEDKHYDSYRNPFGVDFVSTIMIPLRGGSGGSTLPMQLLRSLKSVFPRKQKTEESFFGFWVSKFTKKIEEWIKAPILLSFLKQIGGDEEFARWVTNHMAFIQGGGPYSIFGVELAGRTLFGKSANELSISEQFLLASSVLRPISFTSEKYKKFWWKKIHERSMLCAKNLIIDIKKKKNIINQLQEKMIEPPTPFIDNDIGKLLLSQGKNPKRIFSHPVVLNKTIFDLSYQLVGELRNLFGSHYRKFNQSIFLTMDILDNIKFKEKIKRRLLELDKVYPSRFKGYCFSKKINNNSCNKNDKLIPITVSITNSHGEILAMYSNDEFSNYFGAKNTRIIDAHGRGASNNKRESREIASIGKVGAALLLAETGSEKIDTKWDNECILDNIGCSNKKVSPREVFARSINDALIRRLAKKVKNDRINELMLSHGFNLNLSHLTNPNYTNLVLGKYSGSLSSVQSLLLSALTYIKEGKVDKIYKPTLIQNSDNGINKEGILKQGGITFANLVLESPICHPRGTLSKLYKYCARKNKKIKKHIAKTGTMGTGGKGVNTFDLYIAGAIVMVSGNSYTYVIRAGNGNPSKPIFERFGASKMASIAIAVVEQILEIENHE